jgi:hypothetical protein
MEPVCYITCHLQFLEVLVQLRCEMYGSSACSLCKCFVLTALAAGKKEKGKRQKKAGTTPSPKPRMRNSLTSAIKKRQQIPKHAEPDAAGPAPRKLAAEMAAASSSNPDQLEGEAERIAKSLEGEAAAGEQAKKDEAKGKDKGKNKDKKDGKEKGKKDEGKEKRLHFCGR